MRGFSARGPETLYAGASRESLESLEFRGVRGLVLRCGAYHCRGAPGCQDAAREPVNLTAQLAFYPGVAKQILVTFLKKKNVQKK